MKTKNLLTRISASALLAAAALLPAALTSCSSDSEPAPTPDPIPEGMGRLNLGISVPGVDALGTRADDVIDNTHFTIGADNYESAISSLWVYIFNSDASGNDGALYAALDCTQLIYESGTKKTNLAHTYRDLYVGTDASSNPTANYNIHPGYYKIFAVANVKEYSLNNDNKSPIDPANIDKSSFTVSSLTDQTFDFGTNATTLNKNLDLQLGLPMAANYTDILVGNSKPTNNLVHVENSTLAIQIPLSFLVSGVRVTFLYDQETVSSFNDKFDLNNAKLNNINNTPYSAFSDTQSIASAANTQNAALIFGDYAIEALNSDDTYVEKSVDEFIANPFKLTNGSIRWSEATKKAKQATVYLPENNSSDNPTTLTVTYTLGYKNDNATTTKDINLPKGGSSNTANVNAADGLLRANFYDLIAVMSSSGMEFHFKVVDFTKEDTQHIPL